MQIRMGPNVLWKTATAVSPCTSPLHFPTCVIYRVCLHFPKALQLQFFERLQLQFPIAHFHCTFPTAHFHCTFPLLISIAHFHCTCFIAYFHCTFPLHISIAHFHCTFPVFRVFFGNHFRGIPGLANYEMPSEVCVSHFL